jgi:hypothetical protein
MGLPQIDASQACQTRTPTQGSVAHQWVNSHQWAVLNNTLRILAVPEDLPNRRRFTGAFFRITENRIKTTVRAMQSKSSFVSIFAKDPNIFH